MHVFSFNFLLGSSARNVVPLIFTVYKNTSTLISNALVGNGNS